MQLGLFALHTQLIGTRQVHTHAHAVLRDRHCRAHRRRKAAQQRTQRPCCRLIGLAGGKAILRAAVSAEAVHPQEGQQLSIRQESGHSVRQQTRHSRSRLFLLGDLPIPRQGAQRLTRRPAGHRRRGTPPRQMQIAGERAARRAVIAHDFLIAGHARCQITGAAGIQSGQRGHAHSLRQRRAEGRVILPGIKSAGVVALRPAALLHFIQRHSLARGARHGEGGQ